MDYDNAPFVPLDVLLPDEAAQVGRERSSRKGDCELAALFDGVPLGLDDKVGQRVDEHVGRLERVEHGRSGRLGRHGV